MYTPLNDNQRKAMLKALGEAFDYAAIHCATKEHAAIAIAGAMQSAGFWFHLIGVASYKENVSVDEMLNHIAPKR